MLLDGSVPEGMHVNFMPVGEREIFGPLLPTFSSACFTRALCDNRQNRTYHAIEQPYHYRKVAQQLQCFGCGTVRDKMQVASARNAGLGRFEQRTNVFSCTIAWLSAARATLCPAASLINQRAFTARISRGGTNCKRVHPWLAEHPLGPMSVKPIWKT
jgi:hypothetical protein